MQDSDAPKVELRFPDDTRMWMPLFWLPASSVPRAGEVIHLPESDTVEQHAVRITGVTYDLRQEMKILLDVEPLSAPDEHK